MIRYLPFLTAKPRRPRQRGCLRRWVVPVTAVNPPAPDLTVEEERFVSRPAVDIAADVREETERRIHLAQAGAMASFAEDLEREGEPRAAVMADIRAAFYSEWAADPTVVPPEIEDPPAPADDLAAAVDGAALIAAERRRQVEAEGYEPARDMIYNASELARAAAAYLSHDVAGLPGGQSMWPWSTNTFKPSPREASDGYWTRANIAARTRDLTKAGALIAAEIDRLRALDGPR